MSVIEFGPMGVKPGYAVMNPTTSEGLVLKKAWDMCAKTRGGPRWVCGGVEVEDPLKLWGFFAFDSVAHHERFAIEHGAEAVKDLPTILSHPIFMGHIEMHDKGSSLNAVFQENDTHMILAYFPSTISAKQKAAISHSVRQRISSSELSPSRTAHGWGMEETLPFVEDGKEGAGKALIIFVAADNGNNVERRVENVTESLLMALDGDMRNVEDVLSVARVHVHTRQFR